MFRRFHLGKLSRVVQWIRSSAASAMDDIRRLVCCDDTVACCLMENAQSSSSPLMTQTRKLYSSGGMTIGFLKSSTEGGQGMQHSMSLIARRSTAAAWNRRRDLSWSSGSRNEHSCSWLPIKSSDALSSSLFSDSASEHASILLKISEKIHLRNPQTLLRQGESCHKQVRFR